MTGIKVKLIKEHYYVLLNEFYTQYTLVLLLLLIILDCTVAAIKPLHAGVNTV